MYTQFYYPVKPWTITQRWGVHAPGVYSRFGFSDHNGIDVRLGRNKLIYAPFDGVVYRTGYQPEGGGLYISILSDEKCNVITGEGLVLLDALHCEKLYLRPGQRVEVGDILARADNTGFSTGPHTHFQFRRVDYNGSKITVLDTNNANGSFDPTPNFNLMYAEDVMLVKLSNLAAMLRGALTILKSKNI